MILLATSKVFRWEMFEDPQERVTIEQIYAVASDYLS
jgi:hypothetical protein